MKITNDYFKPLTGELSAHLFENPEVGVARDLYWSIYFDFETFEIEGEEEQANCMVDWLTIRSPENTLKSQLWLSHAKQPKAEASCYLENQHIFARSWKFDLKPSKDTDAWELDYELIIDGKMLNFATDDPLQIHGKTSLQFSSLIIVKENLNPMIKTIEQAKSAMAPFFELTGMECHDDGWRYTFHRPI